MAVAQVNYVGISKQCRGRSWSDFISPPIKLLIRGTIEGRIIHVRTDCGFLFGRIGENPSLGGMHCSLKKLIMPADMIEVGVTGHAKNFLPEQCAQFRLQWYYTHTGIE